MTLKTYRANSMADALAEVKKDLGRDAVILHTRTYKVGGVMGLGSRSIVEITASSDPRVPVRRPRAGNAPARTAQARTESGRSDCTGPPASPASGVALLHDEPGAQLGVQHTRPPSQPTRGFVDDQLSGSHRSDPPASRPAATHTNTPKPAAAAQRGDLDARLVGPRRLATRVEAAPVDANATLALQEELASIRRLVGQVLASSRKTALSVEPAPVGRSADALSDLYLTLVDQQVAPELADAIIGRVRDELTPAELADPHIARQGVLRQIESMLPVAPPTAATDEQRVIALVGPTGVGKTTTLAKLAAAAKLRAGQRVALITCDTYRIAAVDQLRTYANIIGLPLHVVMSPAEMPAAREACADAQVVLIDTPGRSQHDADRLDELAALIDAAKPDEVHLTLPCTAALPVLERTIQRFAIASPTRTILTKLDEGVALGSLVNLAHHLTSTIHAPIGHVTTGQEVPDHIEPARGDRLARLVLEGLAPSAS